MRKIFSLIISALILFSCSGSQQRIRKQVLDIAREYALGNLTDGKKKVLENGLITFSGEMKTYIIDTSRIFIGQIDRDSLNDAIISLFPFENNYEITTEHLVTINNNGRLMLVSALESDMRIISVENGIITAEIPEHKRNSPLFNCPSCWEVVKYRFQNGELVRTE
ncbi:MAG: hypothetical protein V1903_03045 [Bacteroidota bacterium]